MRSEHQLCASYWTTCGRYSSEYYKRLCPQVACFCLDEGRGDSLWNVQSPRTMVPSRCFSDTLLSVLSTTDIFFSLELSQISPPRDLSWDPLWTQASPYLPRVISPQMLEQALWFYEFYLMRNAQWLNGKGSDKRQSPHLLIEKIDVDFGGVFIPIMKIPPHPPNARERLSGNNYN